MSCLPPGWAETTLGEIGDYLNGRGFKRSEWRDAGRPIIRIQNLTGSRDQFNYFDGEPDEHYVARSGDLLVSWAATLGVFVWDGPEAVVNQHIFKVRSRIDAHFHRYLLESVLEDLRRQTHGSGMVHITKSRFANTPVLLPPLAEQERIVATIEEQFSRLEAGVASVREIRKRLARMRTVVLRAATMGQLVPQDQSDEPAAALLERIDQERQRLIADGRLRRRKAPRPIAPSEEPYQLPDGWAWARWHSIAEQIGDIDHKMPRALEHGRGVPYVSPRDFLPDNGIDFESAKQVAPADFERLSAKIRAEIGDVIYPRYGTIGENRLVVDDRAFLVSYSCAVIKVFNDFIDPQYQFIFSLSPSAKAQALAAVNETTQANVGIRSIQEFLVPVPPLAEQRRIASEIDRIETNIRGLEASLTAVGSRSKTLRSAILVAAFSGKLATQDPNDEPAASLLERITTKRALSNGDKPTKARSRRRRMATA